MGFHTLGWTFPWKYALQYKYMCSILSLKGCPQSAHKLNHNLKMKNRLALQHVTKTYVTDFISDSKAVFSLSEPIWCCCCSAGILLSWSRYSRRWRQVQSINTTGQTELYRDGTNGCSCTQNTQTSVADDPAVHPVCVYGVDKQSSWQWCEPDRGDVKWWGFCC